MLYDAILFIWCYQLCVIFHQHCGPASWSWGPNLETNLNVAEEISYLKPLSLLITSVCQVGYKQPQKYQQLLLL